MGLPGEWKITHAQQTCSLATLVLSASHTHTHTHTHTPSPCVTLFWIKGVAHTTPNTALLIHVHCTCTTNVGTNSMPSDSYHHQWWCEPGLSEMAHQMRTSCSQSCSVSRTPVLCCGNRLPAACQAGLDLWLNHSDFTVDWWCSSFHAPSDLEDFGSVSKRCLGARMSVSTTLFHAVRQAAPKLAMSRW